MPASASVLDRSAPATPASNGTAASDASHTLRSLEYGLGLLRQFTAQQPERGIAELALGMKVSRPTAHRYASTCVELGYLEQSRARRYRLTRRCAEPGIAVLETLQPMRAARPILRELRRRTGRTVSLAVLDGAEVLYLQRLCGFQRGSYRLEKGLGAGSRLPARDTAAGRALLSDLGERESERASTSAPGEQPAQAHAIGLTVDEQDARARARGLAIAVRAPGERTSAIELTVPAESLSAAALVAELGEPLLLARARLEAALDTAFGGEQSEERVA
jgi:IclR family transcriptional regulator, pca regulon regulatory protein